MYWVHWTPGRLPWAYESTVHASREDAKREVFRRSPGAIFERHEEEDPHRSRFWSHPRGEDDDSGVPEDGAIVRHGLRANIDWHTYRRDVIALNLRKQCHYYNPDDRLSVLTELMRLEDIAIRIYVLDEQECRAAWEAHRLRMLNEMCPTYLDERNLLIPHIIGAHRP